jgi:AAA domain
MSEAFGETADPAAYVPRPALEAALAELVSLPRREPPSCAALIGEAGLGKTLLLRVLAERLEGAFECLYVPFPRLEPEEFWAWVADALELRRSDDDRENVLKRCRRLATEGTGLLLLVDDARELPVLTRVEVIAACRTPGFSALMAFSSDDQGELADLPDHVRSIEMGPPMTQEEMRDYLASRLRHAGQVARSSELLQPARIAELHAASEGVPGRLHGLLEPWLQRAPAAPGAPTPAAPSQPEPPRPGATAPTPMPPSERAAAPAAPPVAPIQRLTTVAIPRRGIPRPAVLAIAAVVLLGAGIGAGLWFTRSAREPQLATLSPPAPAAAPEAEAFAEAVPEVPAEAEPTPEPTEAGAELAAAEPIERASPPEIVAPPVEPAEIPEPPAPRPAAEPRTAPAPVAPEPVRPAPTPVIATPERVRATPEPAPAPVVAPPERPAAAPPPVTATTRLPPPTPGSRLSVNASPWAEIEIDGRRVGQTPLGELPLAPGPHRVTARLPDGRVVERSIEARGGDLYLTFR